MIIVIMMIAMHLVWIMVTRMHARHASCTTNTTTTVDHRVARTHHIAISEKDIDEEDEDEQDVQQADQYDHKLLATAAGVAHSLLYNRLLHIVGRQHAGFASALHTSRHPARVNGFHLKDHIALTKAHLVRILCLVVINGAINALEKGERD